jgi:hypothetical protein
MELGGKAKTISSTTNINKVYFDLEKQAPAGTPPDRPSLNEDDKPNADTDGHSSAGTKPEGDSPAKDAAGAVPARPRVSRGLTEEAIQEINERLVQEAEHAAPLPQDSDADLLSETAARELLGRSGASTNAGTGNATPGEVVELGKMRGCAKRMKQHFNVSPVHFARSRESSDVFLSVIRNGKLASEIY